MGFDASVCSVGIPAIRGREEVKRLAMSPATRLLSMGISLNKRLRFRIKGKEHDQPSFLS